MSRRLLCTVLALMAVAGCTEGAHAGQADNTPPEFRVDFFGLPGPRPRRVAPMPNGYVGSLPSSQIATLGRTYQIVARLSDPDSGIESFEMTEAKPRAECWSPGRTTIDARGPLLSPVKPSQSWRSPDQLPGTSPTPTSALPRDRILALAIDTSVFGGCPAGKELRWVITVVFAGTNGSGMRPRGGLLRAQHYWGTTELTILRPASV
jgi:hypothetical protein